MKAKTIRRVYLREAIVGLLLARFAVRVVPAARVFAWANRPPRRTRRFAVNEISWVLWAIDVAVEKSWTETLCLPRALATHAMLRRRGISSRICLGVAREQDKFAAHAWVEVGQEKVVAGLGAGAFTRVAEFGGSS
jgi:hypothetical protein